MSDHNALTSEIRSHFNRFTNAVHPGKFDEIHDDLAGLVDLPAEDMARGVAEYFEAPGRFQAGDLAPEGIHELVRAYAGLRLVDATKGDELARVLEQDPEFADADVPTRRAKLRRFLTSDTGRPYTPGGLSPAELRVLRAIDKHFAAEVPEAKAVAVAKAWADLSPNGNSEAGLVRRILERLQDRQAATAAGVEMVGGNDPRAGALDVAAGVVAYADGSGPKPRPVVAAKPSKQKTTANA